jgi:hypothetical protein
VPACEQLLLVMDSNLQYTWREKNGELYPEYTEEHRCVIMCLDGLIQAQNWRGVVAMEESAVAVALATATLARKT